MDQLLLVLAVALTVGAVIFGVMVAIGGEGDLQPAEPDGRALPLPMDRPLVESDLSEVRFDTGWRGYRMDQVDEALRRAAYDIGYKDELIKVLEAEVAALREGRLPEAENLRRTREAALAPTSPAAAPHAAAAPSVEAAEETAADAADAAPAPTDAETSETTAADASEPPAVAEAAEPPATGVDGRPEGVAPTAEPARPATATAEEPDSPADVEAAEGPVAAEAGAPVPRADQAAASAEPAADRG